MANGERALQETLVVNINHVKWYDNDLAEQIEIEWLRLEPRLRQAVQRLVREVAPDFVKGDDQNEREFYIAWEGFNNVERLRDLRSAKVRANSNSVRTACTGSPALAFNTLPPGSTAPWIAHIIPSLACRLVAFSLGRARSPVQLKCGQSFRWAHTSVASVASLRAMCSSISS